MRSKLLMLLMGALMLALTAVPAFASVPPGIDHSQGPTVYALPGLDTALDKTGKVNVSDLPIQKLVDKASPILF